MYQDSTGTLEGWVKMTLEFEGFVPHGVFLTQNESEMETVEDMVLAVLLALTFPCRTHPYPELCAGIKWEVLCNGDEERRVQAIINLIDAGLVDDQNGLISINPEHYQEAKDRAGEWAEGFEPPEGTVTIQLTDLGREMLENNPIEDVCEYITTMMDAECPATIDDAVN